MRESLFKKSWDEIAIRTLRFVVKNGGIWHLWGHSWEIEKNGEWKKLERVFRTIKNVKNKDVKFVNNSDLLLALHRNKSKKG